MAVVATAGGIFVWRSLRAPEFAPAPGTIAEAAAPPTPASTPAPAEVPALARPEDRASYDKGRRLLAAGEVKRSLEPLTDAVRALPHDPAVAHDYGIALVRSGDADRGLFQLERASRLAPGIGSYRIDLVRELMAAGRRGPAVRELKEILTRDPANAGASEMLASLGVAMGSASSASPTMDLGGATGGGSPRPAPAGGAFTNEDLERRRAPMAPPVSAPASPRPIG
jgi:predicted Zn-dependent protease